MVDGNRLRTFDEENGYVKTFYQGKPVWVLNENLIIMEENKKEDNSASKDDSVKNPDKNSENEVEEKVTADDTTLLELENHTIEHATEGKIDLPVGIYQPKEVKISEDTVLVTKNQLAGLNILIDAGHGGKDAGATNQGVHEKNITLSTAKMVAEKLKLEGATVEFTREDDTFISLANRVKKSNAGEADVFISLHYDYFEDPTVNGINTYFYNYQTSEELAKEVHTALVESVDMHDRGVRNAGYYVLENNSKPAILLELGFMTNPENLETVQTEDYQTKVADAITTGLVEYFDQSN